MFFYLLSSVLNYFLWPCGCDVCHPPINDPRPKGDRLTRQFVATQVIPEAK